MMAVTKDGIDQNGAKDKWFTRNLFESEEHFIARVLRSAPAHGLHPIERRLNIQSQHQTWFCVPLSYIEGNYGIMVKPRQLFNGCPLASDLVWDRTKESYPSFKQDKLNRLFRFGWILAEVDFDQNLGSFIWFVDREQNGLDVDGFSG